MHSTGPPLGIPPFSVHYLASVAGARVVRAQRPVRGSFDGRKPRPGPLTWPPTGRIRARGRGEGAKAGGGQRRKRRLEGLAPRTVRRLRWRHQHYGYDGLLDRRRQIPSLRRVAVDEILELTTLEAATAVALQVPQPVFNQWKLKSRFVFRPLTAAEFQVVIGYLSTHAPWSGRPRASGFSTCC